MFSRLSLSFVALLVFASGCRTGDSESNINDSLSSGQAKQGAQCTVISGAQPSVVCASGLRCTATDSAWGTCVAAGSRAKLGESCGGASTDSNRPVQCDTGLICKNQSGGPSFPGTCQKPFAQLGQSCGGAAIAPALPVQCAPGLVCQNVTGDPTFGGTCQ